MQAGAPPPPAGLFTGGAEGERLQGLAPREPGEAGHQLPSTDLGPHAATTTVHQDRPHHVTLCDPSEAGLLSGSGCLGSDGGQQDSPASCLHPARSVSSHFALST